MLRAMVVFAAAGLDSAVTHLLKDALPVLVSGGHPRAILALAEYSSRQLKDDPGEIAELLAHTDPQRELINRLVRRQERVSQQSYANVSRATNHLGLRDAIPLSQSELQPAIECRNQIVHELDVDFTGPAPRGRRPRSREAMITYANQFLDTASAIVKAVDETPFKSGPVGETYDVPDNA